MVLMVMHSNRISSLLYSYVYRIFWTKEDLDSDINQRMGIMNWVRVGMVNLAKRTHGIPYIFLLNILCVDSMAR